MDKPKLAKSAITSKQALDLMKTTMGKDQYIAFLEFGLVSHTVFNQSMGNHEAYQEFLPLLQTAMQEEEIRLASLAERLEGR